MVCQKMETHSELKRISYTSLIAFLNVNILLLNKLQSKIVLILAPNLCVMRVDTWRTKHWPLMACFLPWPCPLATETLHGSEKRTWAWETLFGEPTGAQCTAGTECPKGRKDTPAITGRKALPLHCCHGASCPLCLPIFTLWCPCECDCVGWSKQVL